MAIEKRMLHFTISCQSPTKAHLSKASNSHTIRIEPIILFTFQMYKQTLNFFRFRFDVHDEDNDDDDDDDGGEDDDDGKNRSEQ